MMNIEYNEEHFCTAGTWESLADTEKLLVLRRVAGLRLCSLDSMVVFLPSVRRSSGAVRRIFYGTINRFSIASALTPALVII